MFDKNPTNLSLKQRIGKKPLQHLNSFYGLLPENRLYAEKIFSIIFELVKEKKLDPRAMWRFLEEPIYFQESNFHEFSRRPPLIAKIAKDGGLTLFNYYLQLKYNLPLSAHLLEQYDIFLFTIPYIKNYLDKTNWLVVASDKDKHAIKSKFYDAYGMIYELLGDVFQEKQVDILAKLIECKFDFNSKNTLEHLNQYLYMNRDETLSIQEQSLEYLISHGLDTTAYINLFISNLWDACSLPFLIKSAHGLVSTTSFLLSKTTDLSHLSIPFITKLNAMLERHTEKLNNKSQLPILGSLLSDIYYLQGQLTEISSNIEKAKPYYLKAGIKGQTKLKSLTKPEQNL